MTEFEQEPSPTWRLYGLAPSYHAMGRKKEADAALTEFIAEISNRSRLPKSPRFTRSAANPNRAFEWLERAYAQRDSGFTEMKGDFFLKSLERDPRYIPFLKEGSAAGLMALEVALVP